MEENTRIDLTILGKLIGTCTGWDEHETLIHCYYNFIPFPKYTTMLPGDITINYETGTMIYYDSKGEEIKFLDLLSTLAAAE